MDASAMAIGSGAGFSGKLDALNKWRRKMLKPFGVSGNVDGENMATFRDRLNSILGKK